MNKGTLLRRARVLEAIRAYFSARDLLEVDTPLMSHAAATDPALHSFEVRSLVGRGGPWFLHTSPEFAMKQLLAAGSGDIYQLCHVFRDGERGRLHSPEFTLLEWYRCGVSLEQLMNEVVDLLQALGCELPVVRASYRDLFLEHLAVDPFDCDTSELADTARRTGDAVPTLADHERDAWLDWLFASRIQPAFDAGTLMLVNAYPASQAALARLDDDGLSARRFEAFLGPLELANGFHELDDATEQRRRFEQELARRRTCQLPEPPLDERLLAVLDQLPDCCGVALGVDRLLMWLAGEHHIDNVQSLGFEPA